MQGVAAVRLWQFGANNPLQRLQPLALVDCWQCQIRDIVFACLKKIVGNSFFNFCRATYNARIWPRNLIHSTACSADLTGVSHWLVWLRVSWVTVHPAVRNVRFRGQSREQKG